MIVKNKKEEELKNQIEGFLEYEERVKKIDKNKFKDLVSILSSNGIISFEKEEIKGQLLGILNSEEFDGLYVDYLKWLKSSSRVKKDIIEKILPEKYHFLSNENYLKNYYINKICDAEEIERVKNKVEENIGILKQYNIGDKDLKLFIELIPFYYSEFIDKNLKLFYDNGITDINDLCLLKDGMTRRSDWKEENIKSLNMLGITKPKDLIKLKKIVFSKNPGFTRINLETLKNVGITKVDDLVELQDIIVAGEDKGLLKRIGGYRLRRGNTPETISKCLKLLTENGITTPSDLLLLKEIIKEGKVENLQALMDKGITTSSDLLLLREIIKEGKAENLQALMDKGITTPSDLLLLKEIIKEGKVENLQALMDKGITKPSDLLLLKEIIKEGKVENLQALMDKGITKPSDLLLLREIIKEGKVEILNLLIKNNIITLLVEQGIETLDELNKVSGIIRLGKVDNLKIFIEYGNDFKGSLEELSGVIVEWESESLRILKDKLKFSISDILNLYKNGFYRGINTENLKILIGKGAQTVSDLLEFKDCLGKQNKKRDNIKYLEKIGITTFEELKKNKDIVNFGKAENLEVILKNVDNLELLREGLKSESKKKDIYNIINRGNNNIITVLSNLGLNSVNDLIVLIDIVESNADPLEIKKQIEILFEDNFELIEIKNFRQAIIYGNILIFERYFGKINKDEIGDIEMKVLSGIKLPKDLEFKERNHKGYLKFITGIIDTTYENDKKIKMIKKIVTLGFNGAEKYLEVFKMFDVSISMDIQIIKNELIDEILNSDSPEEIAKTIVKIFEKNNLPLTGKIFKIFELLYPKSRIEGLFQKYPYSSPALKSLLDEGKNAYELIYKDLMNIAIKSGDRSLREYLKTFIRSEQLLGEFERTINEEGFNPDDKLGLGLKLDEEKQSQLLYLFRRISVLYNRYYGKVIDEDDSIEKETTVTDDQLVKYYNDVKKGFHLKKGELIYNRLQRFLRGLGYKSFQEVLNEMNKSKMQAHEKGLKLYNESYGGKIKFPEEAFVKGVSDLSFKKIIVRGITSREYLGSGYDLESTGVCGAKWGNSATSDTTPFDIDGFCSNHFVQAGDLGRISRSNEESSIGYGYVNFVIDITKTDENGNPKFYDNTPNNNDDNKFRRNAIRKREYDGSAGYNDNQYELFQTSTVDGMEHCGIRTGIPMTEVDYIIYTGNFEGKDFQNMCYEIAKNGYYIPVTDREGSIKFTPDMYHQIRAEFNYMEYYDGYDVEFKDGKYVSRENDNTVNKTYNGNNEKIKDSELRELIAENSPTNEKYQKFAEENGKLAREKLQFIKRILKEQCGIEFNSEFDTSIIGARLYDSGSTGRGTDIPTKDVDLDFTLLLDANDYDNKLELIKDIIYKVTGTKDTSKGGVRKDSLGRELGYQIKSQGNTLGISDERPDGIPLDLLILKKSQVIDYSSSDAMKEKLGFIEKNLGKNDSDWIRTNVIIMKKLLKAKGCYKKPEGGISGIGVENRISQHHGSFIEALESFEKVAYGGKYEEGKTPISLEEFKKLYPIYDAGQNYKDGCNDNFVDKLNDNGYNGTLSIIQTYRLEGIEGIRGLIKEYEEKKSGFIK